MRPLLLLLLSACADAPTTWHEDVRPIVDARCMTCHTDDGIGPMSFSNTDTVQQWQQAIVLAVQSRAMPPWGMDPDCRDIQDSQALSDDEIAAFTAWSESGFQMGDENAYVAPLMPDIQPLPPADMTLDFGDAYLPDATKLDDYRCVAVGDVLDQDLYLRGMNIRPDRADLVHHVLLYAVPPGGLAELARLEAEDDAPGFACFGDTGVGDSQNVGGWAPGGVPSLYPEGTAMRVPQGSQLLVQMHYNTAAGELEGDRTQIDLWVQPPDVRPDFLVSTHPIAYTTLDIPAGAEDSLQRREQRVPVSGQIVGVSPHMHTRGRTIETRLHRADGTEECLSRVMDYDFDWQRGYEYELDDAVDISVDDIIEIRCTYDNSDNDERVQWGDGTSDEMCLDYISVLHPNTLQADDTGTCAGVDRCVSECDPADAWCPMTCMSHSSEACLYCGIDQMFDFGGCLAESCQSQMQGYGICVQSCMDGFEDFFECSYETCASTFQPYWECATNQLRGPCAGLIEQECN